MLRAFAVVPPIVLLLPKMDTPARKEAAVLSATVPVASVPMKLPSMRFPSDGSRWIPMAPLPEITLRARLSGLDGAYHWRNEPPQMTTPPSMFPCAFVPLGSVPMKFPSTVLPPLVIRKIPCVAKRLIARPRMVLLPPTRTVQQRMDRPVSPSNSILKAALSPSPRLWPEDRGRCPVCSGRASLGVAVDDHRVGNVRQLRSSVRCLDTPLPGILNVMCRGRPHWP